MIDEPDFLSPIDVTHHAIKRARERLGWGDEETIRAQVRVGILEGRIAPNRPEWSYGRSRVPRDGRDVYGPTSRYIRNEDATYAWVAVISPAGRVVVMTLLLDMEIAHDDALDKRLRTGYERRPG